MPPELGPPPSGLVQWEVFVVGGGHPVKRVEAASWYEARALGEKLFGLGRGEVDARRPPLPPTEASQPVMELGGRDQPQPNAGPGGADSPRRARRR